MSGGSLVDYRYYVIDECADQIQEYIENHKKPEPPTHKVHYVSVWKQVGEGCKVGVRTHYCDTAKGAERYLLLERNAIKKNGHIYDRYNSWADKEGVEHPCEYFISEGEYDEYIDGYDEDVFYGGARFSEETLAEFKNAVETLRKAHIYAKRIDWLLSGDDGESNFHERLQEELKEL